jgi:flagellin
MALRINFNYSAAVTQTALEQNNRLMNKSLLRLSTGLRILNAADDSAGLFIADQLALVSAALEQGNRNIQTGISALQIAENAAGQIFGRLKEIYVKAQNAANDINDPNARAALQREIMNLVDAIQKIGTDTEYNGIKLLDGTFTSKYIHYGPRQNQVVNVSISDLRATSLGAYIASGSGATSSIVRYTSGGTLSAVTTNLPANFVLSSTDYVKVAGITVYQGSATDELIDAAKLARNINTNSTLQQLGIEAVASNVSVANTAYESGPVTSVNTLTTGTDGNPTTVTIDLNFYIGDGSVTFTVNLGTISIDDSGNVTSQDIATLDELVNRINTQAGAVNAPISAVNDNGKLKLVTNNGETIAIEAAVSATGDDFQDLTLDFSKILEFSDDVTTTTVTLDDTQNTHAVAAKVGRIDIAGIDSFLFEYSGVSGTTAGNKGFDFQVASGTNVGLQSLYSIDVSTNAGAEKALLIVKKAIQKVDTVRSQIGAVMNNLQSIYDAQKVAYDNTKEAENVIRNVDFAKEMATFTTMQIRMQAGIAMLAQANTLPQLVLQLLR